MKELGVMCAKGNQSRYFQVDAPSSLRIRAAARALGSKFRAFTAIVLSGRFLIRSRCVTQPQVLQRKNSIVCLPQE